MPKDTATPPPAAAMAMQAMTTHTALVLRENDLQPAKFFFCPG